MTSFWSFLYLCWQTRVGVLSYIKFLQIRSKHISILYPDCSSTRPCIKCRAEAGSVAASASACHKLPHQALHEPPGQEFWHATQEVNDCKTHLTCTLLRYLAIKMYTHTTPSVGVVFILCAKPKPSRRPHCLVSSSCNLCRTCEVSNPNYDSVADVCSALHTRTCVTSIT